MSESSSSQLNLSQNLYERQASHLARESLSIIHKKEGKCEGFYIHISVSMNTNYGYIDYSIRPHRGIYIGSRHI